MRAPLVTEWVEEPNALTGWRTISLGAYAFGLVTGVAGRAEGVRFGEAARTTGDDVIGNQAHPRNPYRGMAVCALLAMVGLRLAAQPEGDPRHAASSISSREGRACPRHLSRR